MTYRGSLLTRFDPDHFVALKHDDFRAIRSSVFPVRKLRELSTLVTKGETPLWRGDSFLSEGIPFLKGKNIKGEIDFDDIVYISENVHKRMKRSVLNDDFFLLTIAGTLGDAAFFRKEFPECNINQDMAKIKLTDEITYEYAVVYFQTRFANRQVKILSNGATRGHLNFSQVRTFDVIVPPPQTQNHIVKLMQSAYDEKKQKDREADAVLASVNDYVMAILGIKMPTVEEKRCFLVSAGEIEGRIDPSAYRLLKTRTVDAINSSMYESTPLKIAVMFRKEVVTEPLELPYVGLENIESNTGFYVPSTEEKESFNSAFKFYSGDVLFPKLRPYLNKVHLATFNGVCSTEFHVLSGNVLDNLFLFAFLRSKLVVNQTTCLMTGNTHPRLQTNDVNTLPIPLPPIEIQNRIAQEVEHRLAKAEELRQEAEAIVKEAKREAERAMLLGISD